MKFKRMMQMAGILACCFVLTACGAEEGAKESGASGTVPAAVQASPDEYAVFHTNKGDFTVQLYTSKAPATAKNFIALAEKGFYNQTIFHRVIADFMIQGGDPTGTGTGGPGYTIPDEFAPGLNFEKPGVLAMANAGPNTGGSQFFITVAPTKWLQNKHAIFGQVIAGYDVVEAISKVKTNRQDKPEEPIVIESIRISKEKP